MATPKFYSRKSEIGSQCFVFWAGIAIMTFCVWIITWQTKWCNELTWNGQYGACITPVKKGLEDYYWCLQRAKPAVSWPLSFIELIGVRKGYPNWNWECKLRNV